MPSTRVEYLEKFGLNANATLQEITKAYRKLAKENHSDHNPNDPNADDKMAGINEAYEFLTTNQSQSNDYVSQQQGNNISKNEDPSKALVALTVFENIMKDTQAKAAAKETREKKRDEKEDVRKSQKDIGESNEKNRNDIYDFEGDDISDLEQYGKMFASHILKLIASFMHKKADKSARQAFKGKDKENKSQPKNDSKQNNPQTTKNTKETDRTKMITNRENQRNLCQQKRFASRSNSVASPKLSNKSVPPKIQPQQVVNQVAQVTKFVSKMSG